MYKKFKFTIGNDTQTIECKPLVRMGEVIDGYYLSRDGDFISTKRNEPIQRIPNISGKSEYPHLVISHNGKSLDCVMHRVMAETFIPLPRPKTISKEAWANTPEETKTYIKLRMSVNHIDHDKTNYNVDNLEWVTAKENADAREDFYSAEKVKKSSKKKQVKFHVSNECATLAEFGI